MKIETDVPVPMSTRSRKYPFLDMQVGESIWFDEQVNGRAYRSALSYRHAAWSQVCRVGKTAELESGGQRNG
jgi:hypothetical protein